MKLKLLKTAVAFVIVCEYVWCRFKAGSGTYFTIGTYYKLNILLHKCKIKEVHTQKLNIKLQIVWWSKNITNINLKQLLTK